MHSLRRAALRAACSSPAAVAAPRQQIASLAMQVCKASARPATMLSLVRHFSQTSRMAFDENEFQNGNGEEPGSSGNFQPADSNQPPDADRSKQIFVRNLTFDATEVHIREAFSKFGEIQDIFIARNMNGTSRGFCFVTFDTVEAAQRAIDEAHNTFWHGRRIIVELRAPRNNKMDRTPGEPTTSLYIGNIPYEASDNDLNQIFRDLDGIENVRVAVDRNTGWPRGFAHADFKDLDKAKAAFEKLQNAQIGGRPLRIDYAVVGKYSDRGRSN